MMILNNGAHVLRALLNFGDPDCSTGFVLARKGSDFVTWTVYRHTNPDNGWEAENGHYFHFDVNSAESIHNADREAKADFAERIGMVRA